MKDRKKTYSFSLSVGLMKDLEKLAGKSYRSRSSQVEKAISEMLEKTEKTEKTEK